jgi:hypothetical protein
VYHLIERVHENKKQGQEPNLQREPGISIGNDPAQNTVADIIKAGREILHMYLDVAKQRKFE